MGIAPHRRSCSTKISPAGECAAPQPAFSCWPAYTDPQPPLAAVTLPARLPCRGLAIGLFGSPHRVPVALSGQSLPAFATSTATISRWAFPSVGAGALRAAADPPAQRPGHCTRRGAGYGSWHLSWGVLRACRPAGRRGAAAAAAFPPLRGRRPCTQDLSDLSDLVTKSGSHHTVVVLPESGGLWFLMPCHAAPRLAGRAALAISRHVSQ